MKRIAIAAAIFAAAGTASLANEDQANQGFDAGTVLATVNGTEITLGHVIVMRERLPQQYQDIPDDVLFDGLVDQLVDQELLAEMVSGDAGSDPLPVRLHLENERRGSLAARVIQGEFGNEIDEADIEAAYEAAFVDFEPQQEMSASHILVASEEEAREILDVLKNGGDFSEVARERSTDPSAQQNAGDLGWFGSGQMVPEFEAAAAALEDGALSEPVQTQFGWHVIRLNGKRDSAPPSIDEVRPQLENQVRQDAMQARLAELREEADIERADVDIPPEAIRDGGLLDQ